MLQQPGGHVPMAHTALAESLIRLEDLAGGGTGQVQNCASVAVKQRVGLGGLIRLWMLSCCNGHG